MEGLRLTFVGYSEIPMGLQYHAPFASTPSDKIVPMRILLSLSLLFPLLLGACTAPFAFPYRPDVQQGNVVTQDMVDRLKLDMSEREVRYLLGSPLLVDPFHPDRWDYYYSLKQDGVITEQHLMTLYFRNEHLLRIEGEPHPHNGT
ncbi:outer membrane protein assembly factor BamE [Gammaproteobacteria bacterium]